MNECNEADQSVLTTNNNLEQLENLMYKIF